MCYYTLEHRDGTTYGSHVMTWLVKGYNASRPTKKHVTRPHAYWVLRRNAARGRARRYKDVHVVRHDHRVPVDHDYD